MDNVFTGASSLKELTYIKETLAISLERSGFFLRQWASNNSDLLKNSESRTDPTIISDNKEVKTLGLLWMPQKDTLQFNVKNFKKQKTNTKRSILSSIAQIFDPLGLINPVTVKAKLIIQELWSEKLGWDELIPNHLENQWTDYIENLGSLNKISIPRLAIDNDAISVELHAFADASEKAYGACIHLISITSEGHRSARLICSKSRVAPMKKQTTAKLELCAALLASHLVKNLKNKLQCTFNKIICWSDSTITLAWIRSSPHKWKTFVANRTTEIQENTKAAEWRYVPGEENPADIVSRGATPSD